MTRPDQQHGRRGADLHVDGPPYVRRLPAVAPLNTVFLVVAIPPALAGVVLFGTSALWLLAVAIISAVAVDAAYHFGTLRTRRWSARFAIVIGLLFACSMPPNVSFLVVVVGAGAAVLVGQALSGGIGNYLWQPVALGRIVVQMLFHDQLTPDRWPVLARGHLVFGDLDKAVPIDPPMHWSSASQAAEALLVKRPVDLMRGDIEITAGAGLREAVATLLRDALPPWQDTLLGVSGGAIGEAAIIVVLLAGALLMWRGVLRWQMAVGAVIGAAALAAICPVRLSDPTGTVSYAWFPGFVSEGRLPVGVSYVLSHLTAGGFLFVVCLLAADPTSSPLTWRGHVLFGTMLGAVTMLLRIILGLPADAYWALLLLNTCMPFINRLTRRRVLGT